jgi:type IV pilus assembly protein PilB
MSRQLAELLVKDRVINQQQFSEAGTGLGKDSRGYIKHLVGKKIIDDVKLMQYLGQKFGMPTVNLAKFPVGSDVIAIVASDLARKCGCIPIKSNGSTLVVATYDPTSIPFLDAIKLKTKLNVEAVLTNYAAYEAGMEKYYGGLSAAGGIIESWAEQQAKESEVPGGSATAGIQLVQEYNIDSAAPGEQDAAPVIQFVNSILSEGIRRGASDIHVEPYEKRFRVRMRVDGVLIEVQQAPIEMKRPVISRLKIMSRMDIAETRVPQDGRIKLKYSGSEMDFRVNSMPTLFGEKVVLRLLSKGSLQLDLQKLGFEPGQLDVFRKGIYAPNGMVLVTGPTGSGKTTTLYSALTELNKVTDNLSTAEDPVEYNLEGINQVQVQKEVGLTFASVLRALLRQDPDTVLVGEIRDYETAEVAIQAALTGHLVLSTLHTNDAPSTITRLMNMGIEPFLVVSSLNTVVAQRLLRRLCSKCSVDQPMPKERLIEIGVPADIAAAARVRHGKGCTVCGNTGYKGRVAIYEVLDFSPTLKEMVLAGQSVLDLRRQAVKEGMKSLRASALTKVVEGVTSLEEALSITMEN